jgi:hypothetical protein
MVWLIWLSFSSDSGHTYQYDVAAIVVCLVITFFSLVGLKLGDDEDDEQSQAEQAAS